MSVRVSKPNGITKHLTKKSLENNKKKTSLDNTISEKNQETQENKESNKATIPSNNTNTTSTTNINDSQLPPTNHTKIPTLKPKNKSYLPPQSSKRSINSILKSNNLVNNRQKELTFIKKSVLKVSLKN